MSQPIFYKLWLIGILLLHSATFFGQPSECYEPSEKAQKLFGKAMESWGANDNKAKSLLHKIIDMEPQWVAPRYHLARKNYKQAEIVQYDRRKVASLNRLLNMASDYFEAAYDLCPSYENYQALYYLGKIHYTGGDLTGAFRWLNEYANHVPHDKQLPQTDKMLERAQTFKLLTANPVDFNPIPVAGICSENDEFMPLIAPDGSYMLFTRKVWKKMPGQYSPSLSEEFSYSNFIRWDSTGNPVFDEPRAMPYPFNQGENQGAAAITIDNKQLFITVCKQTKLPDGRPYKNCDIYETRNVNGKWGELQRMENGINGLTTWEGHPTVSADGKTLYFASYRPGGMGGIDIYYSKLDSTGQWAKPKNLGAPVNSHLNERAPFIHPDNKSLYFASDGHAGIGGYDIFLSRYKDTAWQQPENIGYPINSEEDESGFIVATNGHYAFFSSNAHSGLGGYDILGFELHEKIQPHKMLFVKGKLVDGNGARLQNFAIEAKNTNNKEVSEGMVDNATGKYAIALPADVKDDYILTIRKPNYTFASKFINTKTISDSTDQVANMEFDFAIKEAKAGANSRLNDVLFPFNSTELTQTSMLMLDEFVQYLNDNPTLKIRIEGHTDNVAGKAFNMKLSNKRAAKVHKYLVKKGINRRRLSYTGYGQSKPVAPNSTEEGKALNRRTEFVIVE
ncbi:MAG: OmpA family protein [Salinivirgaceae bacterium]